VGQHVSQLYVNLEQYVCSVAVFKEVLKWYINT